MNTTNIKELRIIQYALCFLNANWDDSCEDDLTGITESDISRISIKFVDLYEKAKKESK